MRSVTWRGALMALAERVDGRPKLEGRALYAADAVPRPHLFAGVVPAPAAPAAVTVDPVPARRLPGVVVVLTPSDLAARHRDARWCASPHGGPKETCMLAAHARYAGEPVAAVVAKSRAELRAALAAVGVRATADPQPPPSVLTEVAYGAGPDEFEAALAACERIYAHRYEIGPSPFGFIEPVAIGAAWDGTGVCQIWSCAQSPALALPEVARIIGVPAGQVRWHPTYVGGGFGGKDQISYEPLAAVLSSACGGRPVLLELSRAETTGCWPRRNPATIDLRTGVDRTGRILAREVILTIDAGADHGHSPDVADNGAALSAALYPAPVTRTVGRTVSSAVLPSGGFRGYGGTEVLYGVEASLDEIALDLGIDPVDIRLRNALSAGGTDVARRIAVPSSGIAECLRQGAETFGWSAARSRPGDGGRLRRGVGVAALIDTSSPAQGPGRPDHATVACRLDAGRFVVEVAAAEIGTGSHTVFAVLADRVLGRYGLPIEVEQADPRAFPGDSGTYGSRSCYVLGNAVTSAATALRQIIEAQLALSPAGEAGGTADRPVRNLDTLGLLRAEGTCSASDAGLVAGAQFAEVLVDTWTGAVTVERVCSVHDIGSLIDRERAMGQVFGGVTQGIGLALTETLFTGPDGVPVSKGFLDHLVPTALDAASVTAVFVEDEAGGAARGLGEAPVMAVAPAIANAIANAVGARLRALPMTSERVLDAIEAMDTQQPAGGLAEPRPAPAGPRSLPPR